MNTPKANFFLLILLLPWVSSAQVLTRGEVYDFDPGDVFQSKLLSYGLAPLGPPTYRTDSVVSKTWSVGMDTLIYQVQRLTYQPPSGPGLPPFVHDTLIELTYADLGLPASHFQLPWPCHPLLDSFGIDPAFCGRTSWMQYTAGDTCFEPATWISTLIAGCGGPYYWSLQPAGPLHVIHELQYFSKDGEECGTLVTGIAGSPVPLAHIILHPNPGTTFQLTGLGQRPALLRLLDLQGRTVREGIPATEHAPVDVGELRTGTYLVEIQLAEGRREVVRWVRE